MSAFRPSTFAQFIGNPDAVKRIQIALQAAATQARMPPHILIYGNAGCGKTSLAHIIAATMGAHLITTVGGSIVNEEGLAALLVECWEQQRAGKRVIWVIDEIHAIAGTPMPQETYFPLLEDFVWFHSLKGQRIEHVGWHEGWTSASRHQHELTSDCIELQPITVIGMTTDPAMIAVPLRDRFGLAIKLTEYTTPELQEIITLHAHEAWQLTLPPDTALSLAQRSRGNPRTATHLLRECQDRAIVDQEPLRVPVVDRQCQLMGIQQDGLTKDDLAYLLALASSPKGLSKQGIASMIRLSEQTIQDMIEPWLKYLHYVIVSNRRHLTEHGLAYLSAHHLLPLPVVTSPTGPIGRPESIPIEASNI